VGNIIRDPRLHPVAEHEDVDLAELRRRAGLRHDLEQHAALLRRESRWPIPFSVYLTWDAGEAPLPRLVREAAERLAARAGLQEEEDVDRRGFLRAGAALIGSAIHDPERVASTLAVAHPFDAEGLEDLALEVEDLQRQFDISSPHDLLRRVRWHLSTANVAVVRSPQLARRLAALTGEMAVLAGRLSFRLHNSGLAEDYFSQATLKATEVGDTSLQALAAASRSTLYSNLDYNSTDCVRSRTAVDLLAPRLPRRGHHLPGSAHGFSGTEPRSMRP
jgi:hypothetical protein